MLITYKNVRFGVSKGELRALPEGLLLAVNPVIFTNVLLKTPNVDTLSSAAQSHPRSICTALTYQIAKVLSSSVSHVVVRGKLGKIKAQIPATTTVVTPSIMNSHCHAPSPRVPSIP